MRNEKFKIVLLNVMLILTMSVILYFIYTDIVKESSLDKTDNNSRFIARQLKNQVSLINTSFAEYEELNYENFDDKNKSFVILANNIMKNEYNKVKNSEITKQEALNNAIKMIKNISTEDRYIFLVNTDGELILNELSSDLEGKNVLNYQDVEGKYIYREIIELAKDKKEGEIEYVLGTSNNHIEKRTYVKIFEPWNIVMATGSDIAFLKKKLDDFWKHELVELNETVLSNLKGGAIPFIKNRDGAYILHKDQNKVGKIVNHKDSKTGVDITKQYFDNIGEKIEYFEKENSNENSEKIYAYIEYYEPLDWVIGYSVYESEILPGIIKLKRIFVLITGVFLLLSIPFSIWMASVIVNPIKKATSIFKDISEGEGDLTIRLQEDEKSEIGKLSIYFNKFMNKMSRIIEEIKENSLVLASSAEELEATMHQIADSSDKLSTNSGATTAAIEEISSSVYEISQNAKNLNEEAEDTAENANIGGKTVQKTVSEMNEIKTAMNEGVENLRELFERVNDITEIVKVINEIAAQTNLLALNAAIEAARAGEAGKGFEVVAEEIRKLAEKTTDSTKEIVDMIKEVQTETNDVVIKMEEVNIKVEEGAKLADSAGANLSKIVARINNLTNLINVISSSTQEQALATDEIGKQSEEILSITQITNSGIEESSIATRDIAKISSKLKEIVEMFKINESDNRDLKEY